MAKTISQRIALEGAELIKSQLADLGKVGEESFKKIKTAAESTDNIGGNITKEIAELRKQFQDGGNASKKFGDDVKVMGEALAASAARVALIATAVVTAAAAIGGALFAIAKSGADAADQTGKAAQSLGLSAESYGRLQYAAEQANIDIGQFALTVSRLNAEIAKTAEATNPAETALGKLGIKAETSGGQLKNAEQVMLEIADAFAKMPDGAEKSALAIEIFGQRAGPRLVPLLNEGRKGIQELMAEAERMGVVFTDAQTKVGDEMGDALNKLSRAAKATKDQLGLLFAPLITQGADAFAEVIARNREGLLALGEAIATGVTPVVQDLVNALLGNEQDIQSSFIYAATIAIQNFGRAVSGVVTGIVLPALQLMMTAFQGWADLINLVFGTQWTGAELLITASLLRLTGAFTSFMAIARVAVSGIGLLVATFGGIPVVIGLIIAGLVALGIYLATNIDWAAVGEAARAAWDLVLSTARAAWNGIVETAQNAVDRVMDVWGGITGAIGGAWDDIKDAAEATWDAIVSAVDGAVQGIGDAFDSVISGIKEMWDDLVSYVGGAIDDMLGWLSDLISKAKAAASAIGDALSAGEGGGAPGLAGGGKVRGAGTTTSDSIPAWLSDKEWVINARAARYYGDQIMSAINRMRLPKDMFRGFHAGGLVQAATAMRGPPLRLATGGPVSARPAVQAMHPLNLTIGGETFQMIAPEETADRLQRFALGKQLRSAGRKPNWYGG
jgi:hypothetical protein